MRRKLIFGAVALVLAIAVLVVTSGTADTTTSLSVRITLDKTTVPAGTRLRGVAYITNSSNRSVLVPSCTKGGLLAVGIQNKTIPWQLAIAGVGCTMNYHVPPGTMRIAFEAFTTYDSCVRQASNAVGSEPLCVDQRPPPLPKGKYYTVVGMLGLPPGTTLSSPLTVNLT
jgi:hypothetical protein